MYWNNRKTSARWSRITIKALDHTCGWFKIILNISLRILSMLNISHVPSDPFASKRDDV